MHSAEYSNQTLVSKGAKVASAVLCSLIKNAEINHSQSLLEMFKIRLANETTHDSFQSLDFSQAFSFELLSREERCHESSRF